MPMIMPLSEARNRFTEIAEIVNAEKSTIEVTKRGKPILAILPWEVYESLVETLDIMSDENLMKTLRKGLRELKAGKIVPLKDAADELGYEL